MAADRGQKAEASVGGSISAAVQANWAGFFDPAWYVSRYPDIAAVGIDPLYHFINHGLAEGRDPNAWFDSAWYAEHYADIGSSGINPLLHYMQSGAAELRNPHPRFDAVYYVAQHPEAAANPLLTHMRVGITRGWLTEKPLDIADYLPSTETAPICPDSVVVDIVIPCYRGLEETQRCLMSVLSDPLRPRGRIIVVDDRSPEPALSEWLAQCSASGKIVLVRNKKNLGFVASVNRGMREAGDHDVVLLNSDTVVPPNWLSRLAAHAYADPGLASVSPLSNNATICGYPGNGVAELPMGLSTNEIDAICQRVNAGRRVNLPTTVGFCMYIKREALEDVGAFDEKAFGRGYGEENDFCMRAAGRGWRHAVATDIFVYHAGSVSFGDEARALAEQGLELLAGRYPGYRRLVAHHVALDDIAPARFAITAELFRASGLPTIVMVRHGLGGGVARHIDDLVRQCSGRANVLTLTAGTRGAALEAPGLRDHSTLALPAERIGDLIRYLRSANVQRLHIHHLAGMDMDIRALIHRMDVPFDLTVHDYYAVCPQVNLLPMPEGSYCGEPAAAGCNRCIAERPSHAATDILSWRLRQGWLFAEAERVIFPSRDARDRHVRYGLFGNALVVPHEPVAAEPWPIAVSRPATAGKLRIVVLGVLANHKGAHIVAALAEAAKSANLDIHLIGDVEDDFPADARSLIKISGKYVDADLPDLLAQTKPHVAWFPAPWPETYSYTLSAAIAAGLPIVASNIGAMPERLSGRPWTWLRDPKSSTEDWIDVFADVRSALRAKPSLSSVPVRVAEPDFYADSYVRPPPRKPVKSTAPIDLRRAGRVSVVVIPERFDNDALSPCAFIRLLQPLGHSDIASNFDIVLADAREALRYRADIVVTQRYAVPNIAAANALARHARETKARLLFDIDDDLLNIPTDHPDAADLRPKTAVVTCMIDNADMVWVSTQPLADRIGRAARQVRVIPNGLDEGLWSAHRPPPRDRFGPVRVLCMGTATHDGDFAMILPALQRLRDEFGYRLIVDLLGFTSSTDLPDWVSRVSMTPHATRSYPGFVNWIVRQPGWDIGLAPLLDNPFNACKSPIKTLDYAALGIPVVASDVGVYRGSVADGPGGMLVANTPVAWHAAVSRLIRDPELRLRLGDGARSGFQERGTLASQAEARRAAWLDLSGQPPIAAGGQKRSRKERL